MVGTLKDAQTWCDEGIDRGVVYVEEDEEGPCCEIDNELDGEEDVGILGGEEERIAAMFQAQSEQLSANQGEISQ